MKPRCWPRPPPVGPASVPPLNLTGPTPKPARFAMNCLPLKQPPNVARFWHDTWPWSTPSSKKSSNKASADPPKNRKHPLLPVNRLTSLFFGSALAAFTLPLFAQQKVSTTASSVVLNSPQFLWFTSQNALRFGTVSTSRDRKITIHASIDVLARDGAPAPTTADVDDLKRSARQHWRGILRSGQVIEYKVWQPQQERHHGRYLLGSRSGLHFEGGTDSGPHTETSTVHIMSQTVADEQRRRFESSTPIHGLFGRFAVT